MVSTALKLDELYEAYYAIQDQLGDTISEHKAETALFGDSWPGAQNDIAGLKKNLGEIEAEIDALEAGIINKEET